MYVQISVIKLSLYPEMLKNVSKRMKKSRKSPFEKCHTPSKAATRSPRGHCFQQPSHQEQRYFFQVRVNRESLVSTENFGTK